MLGLDFNGYARLKYNVLPWCIALCQETVGDHSQVTRAQLAAVEDAHIVRLSRIIKRPWPIRLVAVAI